MLSIFDGFYHFNGMKLLNRCTPYIWSIFFSLFQFYFVHNRFCCCSFSFLPSIIYCSQLLVIPHTKHFVVFCFHLFFEFYALVFCLVLLIYTLWFIVYIRAMRKFIFNKSAKNMLLVLILFLSFFELFTQKK